MPCSFDSLLDFSRQFPPPFFAQWDAGRLLAVAGPKGESQKESKPEPRGLRTALSGDQGKKTSGDNLTSRLVGVIRRLTDCPLCGLKALGPSPTEGLRPAGEPWAATRAALHTVFPDQVQAAFAAAEGCVRISIALRSCKSSLPPKCSGFCISSSPSVEVVSAVCTTLGVTPLSLIALPSGP